MIQQNEVSITKRDLGKAINGAVDSIAEIINSFVGQVDERFNQVDVRLINLESNMSEVKQDVAYLKASHDRLLNTIDGFIKRIDSYETEQSSRDAQFERLLAWARKVSKKTGIPLEGF